MADGISVSAPIWIISAIVVGTFWLVVIALGIAFVWGSNRQARIRRDADAARNRSARGPEQDDKHAASSRDRHLTARSSR